MGKVYAGTQASTGGTVAVKVLMPHVVSDGMLKRFEQEARLLGRLRHPGIAQIYTAGTFAGGGVTLPYFVMEYIAEAQPITDYAEANNLSTTQRLELFRKACEAVAHGHEHGVIHRDLKPANILVDRFGQPKVIDFGVAKCTDADVTMTTLTADGGMVGTLKYMSPEQASGDQDAITVRSDVHALGVILYELLARQMPFDFANALPIGVAQVIKTQDPKPLSSVSRAFRGDLDAITAKCLEKDRHHRYASAAELNAELGRYLSGEAILTRPVGFIGGLLRLFRKHKAAAAAITGVAASLVAAVVGISAFAVRAERERDSARRARVAADAEATTAKQRLYSATLNQLQAALDRPQRRVANKLYRVAEAAYRDAYGNTETETVELTLLKPQLDHSLAVLRGHQHSVTCVGISPNGSQLATVSGDTTWLWDTATGESLAVLRGHKYPITCLSYSSDSLQLATGSKDNTIRLWDAATGESLAVLKGHENSITCIAFSPDGSRLATGSSDGTARLWDSTTGESLAVLRGHEGSVMCLAFGLVGSRLATGSLDGAVQLWDALTGESLGVLKGHVNGVTCLAFSPDGTRLATGSYGERNALLWNTATGNTLAVLTGHKNMVACLAFSPDGTRLATGSSDGTARLRDAATGESLAVLQGHGNSITCLAFSPDGTRLATGSTDSTTRLWAVATGESLVVLKGHEGSVRCLAFNPYGSRVATGSDDKTARLWYAAETDSLSLLKGHEYVIDSLVFSPDGTRLATGSLDNTARIWDVATGESLAVLDGYFLITFSPDGSRLVTLGSDAASLWDAATGESLAVLRGHEGGITSVAFSPDGSRVATGSADNTARLWDAATGESLAVLRGHEGRIMSVSFSPDGSQLATGSEDNTARLWDVATGESLAVLKGPVNGVTCLAFSPDSSRLATSGGILPAIGSEGMVARLWDTTTGESLAVLKGHENSITCIAFSPDGSRLATGSIDGTARLWDSTTGESLAVLRGHEGSVMCLAFSPDSKRLATGSGDNTAWLWDSSTGESLAVLKGHENSITCIAFSPDGSRLATASQDSTARLHGLPNADVYRSRMADAVAFRRLVPIVDRWFADDFRGVKSRLSAACESLPKPDCRIAANLVLAWAPYMAAFEASRRQNAIPLLQLAAKRWESGDKTGAVRVQKRAINAMQTFVQETSALASGNGRELIIAYARPDQDYDDWNLWIWEDGRDGLSVPFQPCELGVYASISVGKEVSRLGYIVRQGDWLQKDLEMDRFIDIQPDGCTALWLTQGCEQGIDAAYVAEARATLVRYEQETPPYGSPPIDIEADRRAAAERRSRLKPLIDDWFTGDLSDVKTKLTAARNTLTADDWHAAANMVLEHASVLRASTPDHEPAEEGAGSVR